MVVRKFYLFSFVRLVGPILPMALRSIFLTERFFLFNLVLFFLYTNCQVLCYCFVDLLCNYFVELFCNIESSCDSWCHWH